MRPRYWVVSGVAFVVLAAVVVAVARSSSGVALPSSMASTGDSITRAFDLDPGHALVDSPRDSWSTGSDPTVDSQYQRILRAAPAINGRAYNDAASGATMAALAGQLKAAAAQRVQYVTVLMGANDLCTTSTADMTPTATFEAQFAQALAGFARADPGAHVLVASIPDIYQLWHALHDNLLAQTTWAVAGICQSMLALTNSESERQQVVGQLLADNAVLASVCHRYANCRWDDNAVYRARFSAADVGSFDYFHPSLTGQRALAALTWGAGYWPGVP